MRKKFLGEFRKERRRRKPSYASIDNIGVEDGRCRSLGIVTGDTIFEFSLARSSRNGGANQPSSVLGANAPGGGPVSDWFVSLGLGWCT